MEKSQLFRGVIADGVLPQKDLLHGPQPRKEILPGRQKDQVMVTIITEGAFAKVNLTLDVLGKREDGYHNIKLRHADHLSARRCDRSTSDTNAPWQVHCYREVHR